MTHTRKDKSIGMGWEHKLFLKEDILEKFLNVIKKSKKFGDTYYFINGTNYFIEIVLKSVNLNLDEFDP
jgi:hypothetical protein